MDIGIFSDNVIDQLTEIADGFFDNLPDRFLCTYIPVQSKAKRGQVNFYNPQEKVPILIKGNEFRTNDHSLGFAFSGSHIGLAPGRIDFNSGDKIYDRVGKEFEVIDGSKKTGDLYWVLNLGQQEGDLGKSSVTQIL